LSFEAFTKPSFEPGTIYRSEGALSHMMLPGSTHLLGAAYIDASSGLTFEVHHPMARPDVWREYLEGAQTEYAKHGVGQAFHRAEIENAQGVSMFFVGRRADGTVAAGIRCHGPLTRVEESESLREMAESPEIDYLTACLERFLPFGVVEQKGAWSSVKGVGPRAMFTTFNRCNLYAMEWLRCEFAICTVREQLMSTIHANGGRQIGTHSVPFPSEKHRTVMMAYRRCRTSSAAKPVQATAERIELAQLSRSTAPGLEPLLPELDDESWGPIVLRSDSRTDRSIAQRLAAGPVRSIDHLEAQREELRSLRPPVDAEILAEPPRWVYYPWRRAMVKTVGPRGFELLRLDRNRNKITRREQQKLREVRIGIVGLSVGHAIAHLLAMEGLCGEMRLADFDDLAVSNLNRIPATLLDLGVNKTVVAARRIAEIDPYLRVLTWPSGIDADNVEEFLDGLDIVIEECDSLDVKVLVRAAARRRGIPVLMETSDRGLLDVERFDLEPQREPFHGLLAGVDLETIAGLSMRDKVPYVVQLLEPDKISARGAASMAEVGTSLTAWPQLAGDVTLGAATTAAAVLRLVREGTLSSGRVRFDTDAVLSSLADPATPDTFEREDQTGLVPLPEDPGRRIAYAASRAPSGGNVQPWRFELTERSFSVFLDPAKSVTMDVAYRGSYIAIGAALFSARVAAAAESVLGPLDLFPDERFDGPVGVLHLGQGHDSELAGLFDAVLHRATNRRKGTAMPIDLELIERLGATATAEKGGFHALTDRPAIARAAELLAESDRLRFLTPATHREMMSELRWPGRDTLETGIDVRTLELDGADMAALQLARRGDVMEQLADWDAGRALGDNTRRSIDSCSALVAVTTKGSRPIDFVRSGAAVMRVWLAAEASSLAVHPMSPLFIYAHGGDNFRALVGTRRSASLAGIAAEFRDLFGLGDDEQLGLVLRLSYADAPSERSLRLPLEAVMTTTASEGQPHHHLGFLNRGFGSRR
jgi:hypothetical protein